MREAEKRGVDPFDFVRTHAEWRPRHQVLLSASLHAYRLAHKTYWEITRESLLQHAGREEALHSPTMLSDFWIEFFDYAGFDLPDFLIRRADKAALRLVPEWTRHLIPAGGGQTSELPRTIRAFAECSLNVKQTARRLGVHTNTVYFRLNRVHKLTGIDPRTFSGASLLPIALRLQEAHAGKETCS